MTYITHKTVYNADLCIHYEQDDPSDAVIVVGVYIGGQDIQSLIKPAVIEKLEREVFNENRNLDRNC